MSYFHLTKIVTQGHTKIYHFLFHRLIQNGDIIGSCSDEHARTCHVGCGMVAGWAGTAGAGMARRCSAGLRFLKKFTNFVLLVV